MSLLKRKIFLTALGQRVTRFTAPTHYTAWKVPDLDPTVSGDTITTEDGIDIITEGGDTIVTE
jgi:hypothetical protein